MRKVIDGLNDLATLNPELIKEWNYDKNIIMPNEVSTGSNKKVWWKCSKGHEWLSSVSHRTNGRKCPYCSGKKALQGVNDLATLFPSLANEWDYDKNAIKPTDVTPGSSKYVWWKCPNGHNSYRAIIISRRNDSGCPVCNSMFQTSFPEQAVFYYIKKLFPDAVNKFKKIFNTKMELDIFIPSINVAIEYDGVAWHNNSTSQKREMAKYLVCKANGVYLYRIKEESPENGSSDKTFNIPKFSYENTKPLTNVIKTIIKEISDNKTINVDIKRDLFEILKYRVIKYEDSLEFLYPDISKEWHHVLNKGLEPRNVLPGTTLKVWWKCSKGHEWKVPIRDRTQGHGCDICAREQRIKTRHDNQLKTRDLLIGCKCVIDWDYSKNKHGPEYYTKGSGAKVWWKCHKCGHEWKNQICDRTRDYKNGCPACSNRILVKGKNDLETTNPELLNEWNYKKNGKLLPSDVTQWSHTKVWWRCGKCGYEYQATPSNRVYGKGCGCCAGRVVVPGINDLLTTRPDIAIDWHPTKNEPLKPSNVTKGRRNMIWWKCHVCGYEWKDTLNHRNRGRGCSVCKKKNK